MRGRFSACTLFIEMHMRIGEADWAVFPVGKHGYGV